MEVATGHFFLAMAVCRVSTCLSVLDAFGMVGGARISRLRMANRTQAVANGASMAEVCAAVSPLGRVRLQILMGCTG